MIKLIDLIYFKYARLEYKIKKLFDFWDMYIEWCKVFDQKTNEVYNKR